MSLPEPMKSNQNAPDLNALAEPAIANPGLALVVVGYGNIASHWLHFFASRLPPTIQVCAVFNSRGSVALPAHLPAFENQNHAASESQATPRQDTAARVNAAIIQLKRRYAEVAVLDLTASKTVSRCYPAWVASGAHLICANKYAGSSGHAYYDELRAALQGHHKLWLYNTTVGAGLPIQRAIQERLLCGDDIIALEGNFSGSLSWILQQYRPGQSFSQWLRQAAELGMTEPDPRLDLSGMDVARKLLILARDSGWHLELADIDIENLVPEPLRGVPVEDFWQQLTLLDARIAACPGEQFHYLGRIEKSADGSIKAYARLQPIERQSPYANLAPGNANFVINSRQYDRNPLIIQGPGAGIEVTAAGVHSDVLHLAQELL